MPSAFFDGLSSISITNGKREDFLARITRQELKKDEFTIRFAALRELYLQHQRKLALLGGAVLLVIAVAVGSLLYVRSQRTQAGEIFARALATFHAPVIPAPPVNNPNMEFFKTDAEKYAAALEQFREVAEGFSWYAQGKMAQYYAALCQRELGKLPEAEQDLVSIAGGGNRDLAGLAKVALAGIYAQTGREEEAGKLYEEMGDDPTSTVPKATAQLALAELYQKIRPEQAVDLYQQIVDDYPGTGVGELAAQRLEELEE